MLGVRYRSPVQVVVYVSAQRGPHPGTFLLAGSAAPPCFSLSRSTPRHLHTSHLNPSQSPRRAVKSQGQVQSGDFKGGVLCTLTPGNRGHPVHPGTGLVVTVTSL